MADDADRSTVGPALAKAGGFVGGAVLGGAGLAYFGYRTLVVEVGGGLFGGIQFVLAFVAAVFALAAPFALGKFLGARFEGRVAGDLVYAVSFVGAFGLTVGIAAGGLYAMQVYDVGTTYAALVVFDAVTGLTAGGMIGFTLARRALWRFREPALASA